MFYTYTHSTPNGCVFYVGKGRGRRVFSMSDRSYLWHQVVNDAGGITMQIVNRFETEQEAYEDEQRLVAFYRSQGCKLVNLTNGGAGVIGYMQSPELRLAKSLKIRGIKHEILTCPHCGTKGGATSIKRWHFDNCSGVRPTVKIRPSVAGKRIYLGKAHTEDEARSIEGEFLDLVTLELSQLGRAPMWTIV